MIREIFIDIDGVLAPFVEEALRALGFRDDQVAMALDYWPRGVYDLGAGLGGAIATAGPEHFPRPRFGVTWDSEYILDRTPKTRHFWQRMPSYSWARDLVDRCRGAVGLESVWLISRPTGCPHSWTGKIQWISEHLADMVGRTILTHSCRGLLSRPGRLLIDDCDANCHTWRYVDSGRAITFPQPWNKAEGGPDDVFRRIDRLTGRDGNQVEKETETTEGTPEKSETKS